VLLRPRKPHALIVSLRKRFGKDLVLPCTFAKHKSPADVDACRITQIRSCMMVSVCIPQKLPQGCVASSLRCFPPHSPSHYSAGCGWSECGEGFIGVAFFDSAWSRSVYPSSLDRNVNSFFFKRVNGSSSLSRYAPPSSGPLVPVR
jgi:hypothetical protein